jgi:hypothetical protein
MASDCDPSGWYTGGIQYVDWHFSVFYLGNCGRNCQLQFDAIAKWRLYRQCAVHLHGSTHGFHL